MAISNDYLKNHLELLQIFGSVSREAQQYCAVTRKVFKTLNDLDLAFKMEAFYCSPSLSHRKDNLLVHFQNTTSLDTKVEGSFDRISS